MWPVRVVVIREHAKHAVEVTTIHDQELVEALRADGADEALGVKGVKTMFTEITLRLGSTRGGDRRGDRAAVYRPGSAEDRCRSAVVAITQGLDAGARGCN